ncbi:SCO3374 family protein [Streptomyces sp. NPDC020362]|uniref:SCO3374 family protein n=1 Tax=unclassified Streptomyces TaxID=2593676 RepID=UPI00340A9C37
MAGSVCSTSTTSSTSTVPLPRRPVDPKAPNFTDGPSGRPEPGARARHWYENELGWPTVPGRPLRLVTGVRFDVLDMPLEAGAAALRHLAPESPVARWGDRMRLLMAAGSAEELPEVLDWLEWGALALDLRALGAGGLTEAPLPPGRGCADDVQGAAVWLRPPAPGCEVEASLPALPAMGGQGGTPDLVRVVDTVAAQCHRVRLRRASAPSLACRRNQPLAFS